MLIHTRVHRDTRVLQEKRHHQPLRGSQIPIQVSQLSSKYITLTWFQQLTFAGGSGYSGTPAPPPAKPTGVLPVKEYLSFRQINLQAVKAKATQFAAEIKTATVSVNHQVDLTEC